jgi:polar amino acid transport system permease protein
MGNSVQDQHAPIIEIKGLHKAYGELEVLKGIDVTAKRGDALYYASYFADKTFNPFVAYPILAFYFVILTFTIIGVFGFINKRLNRHLPQEARPKLRYRPQVIR